MSLRTNHGTPETFILLQISQVVFLIFGLSSHIWNFQDNKKANIFKESLSG